MFFFSFLFGLLFLSNVSFQNNCKFVLEGTDYTGKLSRTKAGMVCLFWELTAKENESFYHHDLLFADGSKKAAKNYCRNPSSDQNGPWCYVSLDGNIIRQYCRVPFCQNSDCQMTGLGMEYSGTVSKSISGIKCGDWMETPIYNATSDYHLCSAENGAPCNSCRNPDSNTKGPWCFLSHDSNSNNLRKELCDIPFCDDGPIICLEGSNALISTFHRISENHSQIGLSVKLWNSSDQLNQRVAILLSTDDVWAENNDIRNWGNGIVLSMGNTKSFLVGSELYDQVESRALLSGAHWLNLTLSWKKNENSLAVAVTFNEKKKPALVADISTADTLLREYPFRYFSLFGSLAFWKFDSNHACLITTTAHGNKTMWRHMELDAGELKFTAAIRVSNAATIYFLGSPNAKVHLSIHFHRNGRVKVESISSGIVSTIADVTSTSYTDYWEWSHFNFSLIGNSMRLERWKNFETELLVNITDVADLRLVRWIAVNSVAVSHWAINCNPEEFAAVPKPKPPDCAISNSLYNGTQDITAGGHHCLFWIDSNIPLQIMDRKFEKFGGRLHSKNYCRNLNNDPSGAFCYTRNLNSMTENVIEKQSCVIRPCVLEGCKLAGNGVDYVGKVSLSKTNRQCREPNDSGTFCSNPDKNIGGPWCYTLDDSVPVDACPIRDCDRNDENTVLVSTTRNASRWYMLPRWRKNGLRFWAKNWVPDRDATVQITLTSGDGVEAFRLIIGGGMDEKIELINAVSGELLKELTMSHLIMSSVWTGLWLHCRKGVVELGRDGSDLSFFAWESESPNEATAPMYVHFGTTSEAWLGLNMESVDCVTEEVWGAPRQYWPVNWRREFESGESERSIDFFLQGNGILEIDFFTFPEKSPYWYLTLEDLKRVSFGRVLNTSKEEILSSEIFAMASATVEWTVVNVRFNEEKFAVAVNGEVVFEHVFLGEIILIYWFNVRVFTGVFTWSTNCRPLSKGDSRAGGWGLWSDWRCSVPCGTGEGTRTRQCDSPPPTLTGEQCAGPATYQGVCNDYPCGDISPELLGKIRRRLAHKADSYKLETGQTMHLGCHTDLIALILEVSEHAKFFWTLNGFVPVSDARITQDVTNKLSVANVSASDSGVWGCSVTWEAADTTKSALIRIVSVVVVSPSPTQQVRMGEVLTMDCNSYILAQVFGDLSMKWLLNGIVKMDYGITYLPDKSLDEIGVGSSQLAGYWTCLVEQEQLHLKWETAWVFLEVLPPRNFWTDLIEDNATSPIFASFTEEEAKVVFLALTFLIISIPFLVIFIFNCL